MVFCALAYAGRTQSGCAANWRVQKETGAFRVLDGFGCHRQRAVGSADGRGATGWRSAAGRSAARRIAAVTRRLRIAEQASLAELHAWPSRAIDVESPELGISCSVSY